jgi:hypothetical protein
VPIAAPPTGLLEASDRGKGQYQKHHIQPQKVSALVPGAGTPSKTRSTCRHSKNKCHNTRWAYIDWSGGNLEKEYSEWSNNQWCCNNCHHPQGG